MQEQSQVDLIARHALIITQDEQRSVFEDGALAVDGGVIVALGTTAEIEQRFVAAKRIDASGRALFPGLLNIHTHLFQSAVKGLGEDMAVEQWVQKFRLHKAMLMRRCRH